ncbi:putative integral membrane protein [Prauserella shujinwangii]|uniref:Putative integral membrane protein n=1 Tax=Prauserella shujinwangii TaxID=1453103 RepID=A0A2T0LZ14_9PSEU|nr:lipopolysaccharide assembly protein LapA domain-containing protein [Prauserella shujinwangii]PRX49361.1 putative integral membrane protein [Prauserella shujinwangii]
MSTSAGDNSADSPRPEHDETTPVADERGHGRDVVSRTRTSAIWVTAIVGTVLLVFLLVFILQNQTSVTVTFLGFSGSIPLGVALLFAAVGGALLVAFLGAARVLQLRRRVRRTSGAAAR